MSDELNGVILQGFHWFLEPDDKCHGSKPLWSFLKDEADHFRQIGIDAVWLPPASKGAGGRGDVGYGIHDPYDLGEFSSPPGNETIATKHGTKQQLHDLVNALHGFRQENGRLVRDPSKKYVQVYFDIVLNHKSGGAPEPYGWNAVRVETGNRTIERWGDGYECGMLDVRGYTHFDHEARNGQYSEFKWRARHFDSIDTPYEIKQNGNIIRDGREFIYRYIYNEQGYEPQVKIAFDEWVSREKGYYDFLTGADLDYGRYDVREEMKRWGAWLAGIAGPDGFRLDAVKHYCGDFCREWIGHVRAQAGRPLFMFAEHLSGNVNDLHAFLTRISATGAYPQPISMLDFPLHFKLRNASWCGESYDLREWNRGTFLAEQPAAAVTFVQCHDYEYGRGLDSHVRDWLKPLAYAFILLRRGGYPIVFFPDYYGSHTVGDHRGQPAGRDYLDLLLKLRKQFALGEERYYDSKNVAGWLRLGWVPGARGAMAVVINTGNRGVGAISMHTDRPKARFYHCATIKYVGNSDTGAFQVVRNRYDVYGDKAEAIWTDDTGRADFLADSGTVSIWLLDGVGLD